MCRFARASFGAVLTSASRFFAAHRISYCTPAPIASHPIPSLLLLLLRFIRSDLNESLSEVPLDYSSMSHGAMGYLDTTTPSVVDARMAVGTEGSYVWSAAGTIACSVLIIPRRSCAISVDPILVAMSLRMFNPPRDAPLCLPPRPACSSSESQCQR